MKLWKYIAVLVMAVTVWTPVRAEEAVADSVATEQAAGVGCPGGHIRSYE